MSSRWWFLLVPSELSGGSGDWVSVALSLVSDHMYDQLEKGCHEKRANTAIVLYNGAMKKVGYFLLAFFLVEIAVFIMVGRLLGVGLTLIIIVATTLLGLSTVRGQGMQGAYQQMNAMQGGRMDPSKMPNAVKLLAGILLIIPGFVTDCLGGLLLIPGVRRRLEVRMGQRFTPGAQAKGRTASNDPDVLEGEIVDSDDDHT